MLGYFVGVRVSRAGPVARMCTRGGYIRVPVLGFFAWARGCLIPFAARASMGSFDSTERFTVEVLVRGDVAANLDSVRPERRRRRLDRDGSDSLPFGTASNIPFLTTVL